MSETDIPVPLGLDWSLEEAVEFIGLCYERDTILDVVMGFSDLWYPARLIMIVGRGWVQLYGVAGFDIPDDLPKEKRRADIDQEALAINEPVATGTAEELGLGGLFSNLELGDPLVRTIGVVIGDRIAIVLVGTIRDEKVVTKDVELVAEVAGSQLETVIRMAKNDELPDVLVPEIPERHRGKTLTEESDFEDLEEDSLVALGSEVSDEEDSEPSVSPNATSFGLPTSMKAGESGESGEQSSSEVSEPSEPSEADEDSETSEGSDPEEDSDASEQSEPVSDEGEDEESDAEPAMPRPMPLGDDESFADLAADSEDDDEPPVETIIGSPFNEDKFPGDIDFGSESVDDSEPADEGVEVRSPRGIESPSSNRTQLGGLAAVPFATEKDDSESLEEDSGPEIVLGPDLMADEGAAPSSAAQDEDDAGDSRPFELLDDDEEDHDEEEEKALPAGTLLGVPSPIESTEGVSRTQLGVGGEQEVVKQSRKPKSDDSDAQDDEAGEAASSKPAKSEAKDKDKPSPGGWVNPNQKGVPNAMILKRRGRGKGRERTASAVPGMRRPASPSVSRERVDTGELKRPEREAKLTPTPVEELGRPVRREGVGEEPSSVDDAWLDDFGSGDDQFGGADSRAEIDGGEEAPSSLHPATLDKLLDSGPEMVDMQEHFVDLDSADRDVAFAAADRVAQLGETALEILDSMFPGRLFLDRYQFMKEIPPVGEHGPVLHALARIGDDAGQVAKNHLKDSSNEARFYAVLLLTAINAEPLLEDLFELLFDKDRQIRVVAAHLALEYEQTKAFSRHIKRPLRAELLGEDIHTSVAAQILGKIRDTGAIIPLIDALDATESGRARQDVLDALRRITLQECTAPYEWRQWWSTGRNEQRDKWLVAALDAPSAAIRSMVHEETREIPGLDLDYHPEQPQKLRKRAQKQLAKWLAARAG